MKTIASWDQFDAALAIMRSHERKARAARMFVLNATPLLNRLGKATGACRWGSKRHTAALAEFQPVSVAVARAEREATRRDFVVRGLAARLEAYDAARKAA